MRTSGVVAWACVISIVGAGCIDQGPARVVDTGTSDAAVPAPDAGPPDAYAATDTGRADGGGLDGGPLPDAGMNDAGQEPADAGVDAAVDATSHDAGDPLSDSGSPDATPGPDSGSDGGAPEPDAGTPGTDAGTQQDSGMSDAGPPGPTMPVAPPQVVRAGMPGYLLLRGTVLTRTGPIDDGEVLIRNDTIVCVAADCGTHPDAPNATIIDTNDAVISPGLIDGHNHLSYNFLPEWVPNPPTLFLSRYQWRSNSQYNAHVDPEGDSDNNGSQDTGAICPGSKWGELRSLIHGTTTVQGQSQAGSACTDRLARNADGYHGLGADFTRATISGPCESGFPSRSGLIADFLDGDARRFFIHMAEGYMAITPGSSTDPLREMDCYAGRSGPGPSLLFDTGMPPMPYGTGVFIHAVPFTTAQLDESVMANVRFVWSPSSNILLYGRTAPIGEMLARGLTVGLGPDWTPSGTDEMLSEMRYALDYGRTANVPALTPRQIWEMATLDGADVVGLDTFVGTLEPGRRADIAVFGRTGSDPYLAVIESRAEDVRLVLVNGLGYYGDLALEATTAVNGMCDTIDACGTEKYLCVAGTPGNPTGMSETLGDIESRLRQIMAAYGRESELLPLIDCSL